PPPVHNPAWRLARARAGDKREDTGPRASPIWWLASTTSPVCLWSRATSRGVPAYGARVGDQQALPVHQASSSKFDTDRLRPRYKAGRHLGRRLPGVFSPCFATRLGGVLGG